MYMVRLLMVIASLTMVECYSAKLEIRFGYGLLYEHRGQLLHGLNKTFVGKGGNSKIHFYSILLSIGTASKLWTIC